MRNPNDYFGAPLLHLFTSSFLNSFSMKVRAATVQKGTLTLSIEVPVEEHRPFLERAAVTISREHSIEGFRNGHAPYDVVARRVGEQAVLQEAAETMVSTSYAQAVKEGHYEVVGSPKVEIEVIASGNPLVYSATVPLLPSVTVGDILKLKEDASTVAVQDAEVEKVVGELREMQAIQTKVERAAVAADRVVVDLSMTLDNVPVEGGVAKGHSIDLNKPHYIPGLADQIIGLKAGETKTFTLPFPSEHYQKHLAGKNVDFSVDLKEVNERAVPEADDAFAQKLGQKDLGALKELLRGNIQAEKDKKEQDRVEHGLLDQLVRTSTFTDIPEMLVTQEAHRMLQELEDNVRRQGGEFNAYLDSIKKTSEELFIEFAPKALERVKMALLMRTIALEQSLQASDEEIDNDIKEAREQYKNDESVQERIVSPEMREYVATLLRNRKVINWIKEQIKKA